MTENREPSGIALSVVQLAYPHNWGMNWGGYIGAGDKHIYMVCSEGVGYDLTKMSPERIIERWGKTRQQLSDLIVQADEGQIDLELLIRQFGDRLEANYQTWVSILTDADKVGA